MKTSLTHPLQIDTVATPGGGQLGLTFCPGKRQPTALTGPWDRDLDLDLAAIQAWGADALVTLMEAHELTAVQVADLAERAEALGIDWHFLPIRDVDIPNKDFERLWTYHGAVLRQCLARGGRVLVHCRGGLGRTGLVAGRLLIELGHAPDEAVRLVRQARPGTIETAAQLRYTLACRPPAYDETWADRLLGCLLGGAVGDAFGYEVEFSDLVRIQQSFGPEGMRDAVFHQGQLIVSDDTQMTLFTAEGLLRALAQRPAAPEAVAAAIRSAYLDWLSTQTEAAGDCRAHSGLRRYAALYQRRAPGNTCLSALRAGGAGTPELPINDSKGCGGVMRTAPLGLVATLDASQAFDLGCRAAALTHGHPDGYLCAGAMAMMVRWLCSGETLEAAARQALQPIEAAAPLSGTARLLRLALALDRTAPGCVIQSGQLGQGWVGDEALAIGLYAALCGRDWNDVLSLASNHDGDSDSTASIAGQLYGASRGLAGLPHAWIRRLDVLEALLEISQGLLRHAPARGLFSDAPVLTPPAPG